MEILKEIIGPNQLNSFLSNHLFRSPYAAPFSARKFAGLADWNLLNEIFKSQHNNCWLVSNGKLPDDATLNTGVLTAQQAEQSFHLGKTILIRHAEKAHPKLSKIAKEFHDAFHSPVDIQIYATPKEKEGFDWHYDIEDVFIIQTHGEKEFRLIPNTVTSRPLPVMTPRNCRFRLENKKTEIRCWLKAGDFLYIPAGYWHKAKAVMDSIHLSAGVLCQASLPG